MQQLLNKPGKQEEETHPDEVPDLQPKKTLTKTSTTSLPYQRTQQLGHMRRLATTPMKAYMAVLRRDRHHMMGFTSLEQRDKTTKAKLDLEEL